MESGGEQSSFWKFSDQLRLHTAGIAGLSLGDSIWSDPFLSAAGRRLEDRRNNVPQEHGASAGWIMGLDSPQKIAFTNNSLSRYNNSNLGSSAGVMTAKDSGDGNYASNYKGEIKNYFSKTITKTAVKNNNTDNHGGGKSYEYGGKGAKNKKNNSINKDNRNISGSAADKRFKTLPPSEALPRSDAVGGYIFVCNNETMEENLMRQLFGLPPRYRDSVRAITPGLPIFLYNYSTHHLHGIFEAASFGGTNIDPAAWEDKKHPGESRFPAQVRVITRKNCEPLEEDSFRPILHHYDGPKFRLELSVPEALALLDVFVEQRY